MPRGPPRLPGTRRHHARGTLGASSAARRASPCVEMMDEGVGDLLPLDDHGIAGPRPTVDQSGLLEQPAVDRIEEQLGPGRHLDDLGLGGRHGVGAAQVGDEQSPPLGQRLADGTPGIEGLVERPRPQRPDGASQLRETMMLPATSAPPGAIVGPSRAPPGVSLADRSRGRFRFPLGQELERDATTPGPRRLPELPTLAPIPVRDPPDRVSTACPRRLKQSAHGPTFTRSGQIGNYSESGLRASLDRRRLRRPWD
jgi:hypothetical protein